MPERADDPFACRKPTSHELDRLGRTFQTVLDCGLFHTFNSDERPGYVVSLASVTEPGGTLYVLCFSDEGPDTGPHPVSQDELRAAFTPHDDGAPAWFATIKRVQPVLIRS